MPNTPIPAITHLAIQEKTTGQVDYLKFSGATLVASDLHDYDIRGFQIVAHGDFNADGNQDLIAQNTSTGVVDFLYLDEKANLVQSALSVDPLPHIVGAGPFNGDFDFSPVIVSQLPDGQLDMLGFNTSGALVSSYIVPDTKGYAPVVGVGAAFDPGFLFVVPAFAGVGGIFDANVALQLPDGSLDFIGFTGNFADESLRVVASYLLAGTEGLPRVAAINQTSDSFNFDIQQIEPPTFSFFNAAVQVVAQYPDDRLDALYFNSGYSDLGNEGLFYASNLYSQSFLGWENIDGSAVAVKALS